MKRFNHIKTRLQLIIYLILTLCELIATRNLGKENINIIYINEKINICLNFSTFETLIKTFRFKVFNIFIKN
jgi:hypothetical protein